MVGIKGLLKKAASTADPLCLHVSCPFCLMLLLLHILALCPIPSRCFCVWKGLPSLLFVLSWARRITSHFVKGQPVASFLEILVELQRLTVMLEPCKLKSCISTKDCIFRFGKHRSRMLWGMMGKVDCLTWEGAENLHSYMLCKRTKKWALELTTWIPAAGDTKRCVWRS